MLNIYERIFSLINPKLYDSPYKKHVDEVWEVLKKFKFCSWLLFFYNMIDLEIDVIENSPESVDLESGASYNCKKNRICIFSNLEENLNHELFHASSRGFFGFSGLTNSGGGEELTEGITEYLALRSQGKYCTFSAYEEHVFVIEFLTFIYGEEFINFYLQNRVNAFYCFFGQNEKLVNDLDGLLRKIQNYKEYQTNRRLYLLVVDIVPAVIKDDIEFLLSLELNHSSDFEIRKILSENYKRYYSEISLFLEKCANMEDDKEYIYQDFRKEEVLQFYIKDYCQLQESIMGEVLDILIELAEKQQITRTSIELFLERTLENKTNEFQNLYGNLFLEKYQYKCRKR